MGGVDEALRLPAGALVGLGGLGGQLVGAAVDGRVRRLHEPAHGVDDDPRLLAAVGRVEVDDRPPVDLDVEDREVLADAGDVERAHGAALPDPAAERLVALPLELLGQLEPAGGHDAAVDQDVHVVGRELVEQALVVGDEHDAELGPVLADLPDAAGDRAQGVDVEAGVGLVEDGQLGLEDGHLQDLVALLLAAREALVEVAVGEDGVHAQPLHPLHDRQPQLQHRQVDALAGRQGLAQELDDRDAGDLLRVLEGEEHAGLGPHLGRPVGDVVALVEDPALRDLVLRVGEQGVGEGRLARAVGAHEGVDLPGLHRPGRSLAGSRGRRRPPDLAHRRRRSGVQILDAEQLAHGSKSITTTRIVVMPSTCGELSRAARHTVASGRLAA